MNLRVSLDGVEKGWILLADNAADPKAVGSKILSRYH